MVFKRISRHRFAVILKKDCQIGSKMPKIRQLESKIQKKHIPRAKLSRSEIEISNFQDAKSDGCGAKQNLQTTMARLCSSEKFTSYRAVEGAKRTTNFQNSNKKV